MSCWKAAAGSGPLQNAAQSWMLSRKWSTGCMRDIIFDIRMLRRPSASPQILGSTKISKVDLALQILTRVPTNQWLTIASEADWWCSKRIPGEDELNLLNSISVPLLACVHARERASYYTNGTVTTRKSSVFIFYFRFCIAMSQLCMPGWTLLCMVPEARLLSSMPTDVSGPSQTSLNSSRTKIYLQSWNILCLIIQTKNKKPLPICVCILFSMHAVSAHSKGNNLILYISYYIYIL